MGWNEGMEVSCKGLQMKSGFFFALKDFDLHHTMNTKEIWNSIHLM